MFPKATAVPESTRRTRAVPDIPRYEHHQYSSVGSTSTEHFRSFRIRKEADADCECNCIDRDESQFRLCIGNVVQMINRSEEKSRCENNVDDDDEDLQSSLGYIC